MDRYFDLDLFGPGSFVMPFANSLSLSASKLNPLSFPGSRFVAIILDLRLVPWESGKLSVPPDSLEAAAAGEQAKCELLRVSALVSDGCPNKMAS